MVHANPYSSGAASLVFVYSITRVVAPSYGVVWCGGRSDPVPEVPTLLYIGRRCRVTERAIGLTDYVPSLLQQIDPSYHQDTPVSVCIDLHVGRPCQPLQPSFLTAAGPIAWR